MDYWLKEQSMLQPHTGERPLSSPYGHFSNRLAASPHGAQSSIRIEDALFRHTWVVGTCLLLGLLGAWLKFKATDEVFESSAQVIIERKNAAPLPIEGYRVQQHYQEDSNLRHKLMLESPQIAEAACRQIGGSLNPDSVLESLDVSSTRGTDLLSIRFRGPEPNQLPQLLSAVIQSYREHLLASTESVDRETRELITKAKGELFRQLETKEEAYGAFRESLPVLLAEDGTSNSTSNLAKIKNEQSSLTIRLRELESELKMIRGYVSRGRSVSDILGLLALRRDLELSERRISTPLQVRYTSIEEHLLPLMMQREDLLARFGRDHPKLRAIDHRIKFQRRAEQEIQRARDSAVKRQQSDVGEVEGTTKKHDRDRVALKDHVHHIRHQIGLLKQKRDHLDLLYADAEKAAKGLVVYENKDRAHKKSIARTQTLFDSVVKRFEELSVLEAQQDSYSFQIIRHPEPGERVEPRLLRHLAFGILMGGILGAAIAYFLEMRDDSFRSPDEVMQSLGLPIFGHIPAFEAESQRALSASQLAPPLLTVHCSSHPAAEGYRTVRTALYFTSSDIRLVQVTSPQSGDGKSTLSANLAITIAQSGKRTVLVEADFRRPTLYNLFGVAPSAGLSSVLENAARLNDVFIDIDEVPNLSLLCCGKLPANPSEMVSSSEFGALLMRLKAEYDYVIVDTPPVLAVSDALAISTRVDGVLMTLRVKRQLRRLAIQSREALREYNANILGVVVNGVDTNGGYAAYKAYGYRGYYGTAYVEGEADTPKLQSG